MQNRQIKFHDDEPEGLGPCESDTLSTTEFYDLKRYQVDQDFELINTLTHAYSQMYYVDLMGNLLSNQKLAFYEWPQEPNYFSKMMQDGRDKD